MDAPEHKVTAIIAVSPADMWDREALEALAMGFGADCRAVFVLPHLYHIPDDSPIWDSVRILTGPVRLITRMYPRPAEWLLRAHAPGITDVTAYRVDDFASPEGLLHAAKPAAEPPGEKPPAVVIHHDDVPSRWYPVQDASRCTHCGHCVQFCLFGAWSRGEDGKVAVTNPDACKDGCPACARICPQGAIIFPEYLEDPAISGATGRFVEPDAAARRMYYLRTGIACPVCGQTGKPDTANLGEPCPECGRRTPATASPPASATDPVLSDIDSLIDDLEKLQGRCG